MNRRDVIGYIIKSFLASTAGTSVVLDKSVPEVDAAPTPPTPPPASALVYPRWGNGASDLAGFRAEADLVSTYGIQGPGDNDVLEKLGGKSLLALLRAGKSPNPKCILLYQLWNLNFGGGGGDAIPGYTAANWRVPKYQLYGSNGNPVKSSDGGLVYCVKDPAMATGWARTVKILIDYFGLDGVWIDGPAGYGNDGTDKNGVKQSSFEDTHQALKTVFFPTIRQILGPQVYIAVNTIRSYFAGPNRNAAPWKDQADFAPWVDAFNDEFFLQTYSMASHMAECYYLAFDAKRNISLDLSGANSSGNPDHHALPASYRLFELCAALMFVGNPFTGPCTKYGSRSEWGFAYSKIGTLKDMTHPLYAQYNHAVLGDPAGPPTFDNPDPAQASVWRRQFKNGYAVTCNLGAQTGTITKT